jgi:hypothetical protein
MALVCVCVCVCVCVRVCVRVTACVMGANATRLLLYVWKSVIRLCNGVGPTHSCTACRIPTLHVDTVLDRHGHAQERSLAGISSTCLGDLGVRSDGGSNTLGKHLLRVAEQHLASEGGTKAQRRRCGCARHLACTDGRRKFRCREVCDWVEEHAIVAPRRRHKHSCIGC